jgi:hypothetical protein
LDAALGREIAENSVIDAVLPEIKCRISSVEDQAISWVEDHRRSAFDAPD